MAKAKAPRKPQRHWIPRCKDLATKQEVVAMALMLRLTGNFAFDCKIVAEACCEVWDWFDSETTDGRAVNVRGMSFDSRTNVPGLSAAMMQVGWLVVDGPDIVMPNFIRFLGESAKKRLGEAYRKRINRTGADICPQSVRPNADKCPAESGTTETETYLGDESPKTPLAPSCPAASEPAVLTFPCVGKGPHAWDLTESKLAEYREAFPGVDVLAECRKARQWCVDNPKNRKTAGGMPRFLTAWLSRAQDTPKSAPRTAPGASGRLPGRPTQAELRDAVTDAFLRGDLHSAQPRKEA